MAWERRGKRHYLYRSVRDDQGRVRKLYFGCGLAAKAELDRQQQHAHRLVASRRYMAECREDMDQPVAEIDAAANEAVTRFLFLAGFHKHHGQWRRSHVDTKTSVEVSPSPSRPQHRV